ncbi:MAG: hypothetical protein U0586_08820 [Candidatus Brocadiaceae bacterium]
MRSRYVYRLWLLQANEVYSFIEKVKGGLNLPVVSNKNGFAKNQLKMTAHEC